MFISEKGCLLGKRQLQCCPRHEDACARSSVWILKTQIRASFSRTCCLDHITHISTDILFWKDNERKEQSFEWHSWHTISQPFWQAYFLAAGMQICWGSNITAAATLDQPFCTWFMDKMCPVINSLRGQAYLIWSGAIKQPTIILANWNIMNYEWRVIIILWFGDTWHHKKKTEYILKQVWALFLHVCIRSMNSKHFSFCSIHEYILHQYPFLGFHHSTVVFCANKSW